MDVRELSPQGSGPRHPDAEDAQPLSPAQERLWFLHQYDPDDASFNLKSVYRLRGPLDARAMTTAFTSVAARHETLRTRFPDRDGQPVAVVDSPTPVPLEHLDLTGLAPQQREQAALRLVAERTNTPFDLAAEPPLRVTLLRLADDDHVLCAVVHHIAGDGWSQGILRRELATSYAAVVAGTAPDLPPLPVSYGDHVRRQRDRPSASDSLAYWTAQLADAPALDLPTDHPRPAERRSDGDVVAVVIPGPLGAELERLARERRVTLFTLLLAAYQTMLARHTGQADILVGVPVAGRDRSELEPLIGMLVTHVVLRGDLSGDPTFADLLKRTRRTLLRGMTHADMPFERLLVGLNVERDLSRTPLFDAMLVLHVHPGGSEDPMALLPGITASRVPSGHHPAKVDLTLDLWPPTDGTADWLHAAFTFSTSLFERATVERLAERFKVLLASIVADPHARLSALRLLPDGERAQLVSAWNDTGATAPDGTVVDLIARQAAASPGAVAVTCGTDRLTYAELMARATTVAQRLHVEGIGPGALVAVCLERSVDIPVALLGVAMAGAAYVPVDPGHPSARIAHVLADAGTSVAITHRRLRPLLPAEVRTLPLEDPPPGERDWPPSPARPMPDDTAYVIYTSGSTGRPKGVVVSHAAQTNFLEAMRTLLGAAPEHVWLGLTTLSFDMAAAELLLPLTTGGQVVVADDVTAHDGRALARLIRDAGVTHVQATPSVWRMLLAGSVDAEGLVALVGGEAVPPPLARELRARTRRLVNLYGPTETTVWSTAWEVPADPDTVSIGRPIANTTVRILDADGNLAPIGVPGELHIGGAGVARGYLGRPALTAERFTPDPFGPPGSRRYRTGDRARWRADGTIEFLGRTDNQVKLRGHRVELGEVEAVLEAHPAIDRAAVVVRDETLVAYVVGAADRVVPHAAATLPPYMVPSVAVSLDALPLTPNGKVDRQALPTPDRPAAGGRAPNTPFERLVADTFADAVGLGRIHADDDFFAIGGHSLLTTRVAAHLSDLLEVEIPVRELFAHPTVAGLAAAVERLVVAALAELPEDEAARLVAADPRATP